MNTCIPCNTPKKTFYGHSYNRKLGNPCSIKHSIIGPDTCSVCVQLREKFNIILDSPAREDSPGEKWYFCGQGIRYYGNQKTNGWVNEYDESTWSQGKNFELLVKHGKTRNNFNELGYLRTIRDIFRVFGFGFSFGEEWTWWSCYSPKSRNPRFYAPYELSRNQEPQILNCRPKMGGCGEKCDTIIKMINDANYLSKIFIDQKKQLLKREVTFLKSSGIKTYNEYEYKKYMSSVHNRPIFQCGCAFHTQFAFTRKALIITPKHTITYYQ